MSPLNNPHKPPANGPRTSIDSAALGRRLALQSGRAYWRSLEELADSEEFTRFLQHEFPRLAEVWNQPVDRRQALKLMAASMALAGLSACGRRQPPEAIVPYVNMPENQVPGIPLYYASAVTIGGYAEGIVAETREGRPVKVEGNPDHPASLGASNVFTQAMLLGLYDPERSQAVTWRGEVSSYGRFLGALSERRQAFEQQRGAGLCILTEAMSSPSQIAALRQLLQTWPEARWFVHDAVSRRNVYQGAEWAFGQRLETYYRFDRASIVLSLDGDFMDAVPGHLRYARDFMSRRRLRDGGGSMNRLYVAESTPTITGAKADHRLSLPAAAVLPLACALARRLGIRQVPAPAIEAAAERWAAQAARDLRRAPGAGIVLAGDQQPPALHALVQVINRHLGNTDETIVHTQPVLEAPPEGLGDLSRAMAAGEVHSLLILGADPVYTAPPRTDFAALLPRVPFSVHWGEFENETGRACTWHLPAAHPLESWGDARAFDGTISLIQPLISPLYGGLSAQQVLAAFNGDTRRTAGELLFDYWRGQHQGNAFERFRRQALQEGVITGSATALQSPLLISGWRRHLQVRDAPPPPGTLELQLRPDPCLWDGRFANNGWLQELPKPLTKLTWGNAALIAPALARQLALDNGRIVELHLDGRRLRAPVWIQPGQPPQSVLLHLGHGGRLGRVADAVGVNAYPLQAAEDGRTFAAGLQIRPTPHRVTLASTQHHHSMEGREPVREATLEEYRENPAFATAGEPLPEVSLYPPPTLYEEEPVAGPEPPPQRELAWGMVVDVGACIGCNACVIACQAENNIPVVGAREVERGHALHWLRVDRYFSGPPEAPAVHFQPVPCMHCEKAPCESVCPVEATLHDAEGLNEMIYNRCIGTRYCSQNCPYKVRRFNWFHYTRGPYATPAPAYNPDVTVRSRGVMEKCTYCIQRLNRARREADAEHRPLRANEVQTACQQACPTEAIVFGDINRPDAKVTRYQQHSLNYALLAELNTRPRTTYLAGVRNPNPALEETLLSAPNPVTQETTHDQPTHERKGGGADS